MDGSAQEDEWEQCKENVQPLKGGRKITDLRKVLTSDGNEYMKKTIQNFEYQLRNAEGDLNQLDVWHSYITWMEQNSTQTKEVIPLMQRCVMFFKKKTTVNQNKKYVEIWVKMSEGVDDPNLIFEYMFDHDIGTSLSLFYICWAEHFETIGATKKSDELYTLGINRSAQPLDVLKEGKRMFEMRMAKSSSSTSVDADNSREVLAGLSTCKSGKVPSNRIKKEVKKPSTSQKISSSGPSFQIFNQHLTSDSVLPAPSKGQSKILPTDPSLHIENTNPITVLKGTKIKGGGSSASVNFPIYQEEVQTSNTLHKHVTIEDRKPLSAIKVSRDEPYCYKELPTNSKVVDKYCKDLIYMGNREFSFEELKAMTAKYAHLANTMVEHVDKKSDKFKTKLEFSDKCMIENEISLKNPLPHSPAPASLIEHSVNGIGNALKNDVSMYLKEISMKNENAPLKKTDKNTNLFLDIDITENLSSKSNKVNQNLGHLIDSLEMTVCFPSVQDNSIFNKKEIEPGSRPNKNNVCTNIIDSLEMTVCLPSIQDNYISNKKEIKLRSGPNENNVFNHIIDSLEMTVCLPSVQNINKEIMCTSQKQENPVNEKINVTTNINQIASVQDVKHLLDEPYVNSFSILQKETESSKRKSFNEVVPENKKLKSDLGNSIESMLNQEEPAAATDLSGKSSHDFLTNNYSQELMKTSVISTAQNAILNDSFDLDKLSNSFYEEKGCFAETKKSDMCFNEISKSFNERQIKPQFALPKCYETIGAYQEPKTSGVMLDVEKSSSSKSSSFKRDGEHLEFLSSSEDFISERLFAKTPMTKKTFHKKDFFPAPSPSITLNTKYAKDNIQSLFNESLDFDIDATDDLKNSFYNGPKSSFLHDSNDSQIYDLKNVPLKPCGKVDPVQSKVQSKPLFEIFPDAPVKSKVASKPAFEIFPETSVQSKAPSMPAFEIFPDTSVQSKAPSMPAFEIFSDASVQSKAPSKPAFEIFSDAPVQSKAILKSAFEILPDASAQSKVPSKPAFAIFSDAPVQLKATSKSAFAILPDSFVQSNVPLKPAFDIFPDTAFQSKVPSKPAFEVFSDAPLQSKVPSKPAFEIFPDASVQLKPTSKSAFKLFPDAPVQSKVLLKPAFEIFSGASVQLKPTSKSAFEKIPDAPVLLPNKNKSLTELSLFNFETSNEVISGKKPFEIEIVSEDNKNYTDADHGSNTQNHFKKPLSIDGKVCCKTENNHEKVDKTTPTFSSKLLSKSCNTSELNSFKDDLSYDTTQIKQIPQRYSSTPFNDGKNKFESFDCSNLQFDGHTENIAFNKIENRADLSIINERSKEDTSGSDQITGGSDDSGSKTSVFSTETGCQFIDAFKKDSLEASLKIAMGLITQSIQFLNIHGKLPKLQGTEMELNLGPRKVRIRKSLKKNHDTTSYKGVNLFSKLILLKISKGDGLKMLWDFYISILIQERVDLMCESIESTAKQSFIRHYFGLKYFDAVCIESPFHSEGTLKDLLELYRRHNQTIDEILIMLYAYEILRILKVLHQINIIHTDICLENFLLGDCNTGDGTSPLDLRCLVLKGFYESIDLNNFGDNVMFFGSRGNEDYECPEMFDGSPWKFQVDYFAAASTIHFLIFQTNMNTYVDPNTKRFTICNSFKASWNDELWTKLFSVLINFSSLSSFLSDLIDSFANELCQRSDELKIALSRKNDLIMEDE